jgi:hypothetical protein
MPASKKRRPMRNKKAVADGCRGGFVGAEAQIRKQNGRHCWRPFRNRSS